MHGFLKVMKLHVKVEDVWVLTGPLQNLESLLFQPFWCRFAGVPCFSCHIDDLTFDSRKLWNSEEFVVD